MSRSASDADGELFSKADLLDLGLGKINGLKSLPSSANLSAASLPLMPECEGA